MVFAPTKLILVSGKGGIGKTLVTSSIGLLSAKKLQKKTLLVENSYSSQLYPVFEKVAVLGDSDQSDKKIFDNLYIANLDAKLCFKEYLGSIKG